MSVYCGDSMEVLRGLDAGIVQTCVTSPPYWGLRDYGHAGQLGLERTPEEYVERLVTIFREVKRVLRDDGTLWLNLGDSYTGSGKGGDPENGKQATNKGSQSIGVLYGRTGAIAREAALTNVSRRWTAENGMAPKNLVGIPWRVAFALQADGWYLRSDIIWSKPNPMPESVTDRPTKSHEYLFLLSKSARYYYDADAIRQPHAPKSLTHRGGGRAGGKEGHQDSVGKVASGNFGKWDRPRVVDQRGASARSVWTITTQPYAGAHFATFPEELPRRCILAGSRPGDTVLDPFAGSGTTLAVAQMLGRDFIGIELNPVYHKLIEKRLRSAQPPLIAEAL